MAGNTGTKFTDLPAELRTYIYDLSGDLKDEDENLIKLPFNLPKDENRFIRHHNQFLEKGHDFRPVQPALTKVSKQVRNETLPMFYGALVIKAIGSTENQRNAVCGWVEAIGHKNAGLIRRMILCCRTRDLTQYGSERPHQVVWKDCKDKFYSGFALRLNELGVNEKAIECYQGRTFEEIVAAGKAVVKTGQLKK